MKTAMDFLMVLERQYPLLFWSSIYTAVLLVISLGAMPFDQRLINNANPWLKPVKFEISILVFNLTIGWYLLQLTEAETSAAKIIAAVVGLAMMVEISAISLQAARGVLSHFNFSTPLNAAIFGTMAIAIICNTAAVAWLGMLSFGSQPQLPGAILWGMRLGIVMLLFTSLQGFQIVGNKGHTVGAADGGPGLPVVRWSTTAGDLRIAHFVGMHGLQLLPLLGFLLSRSNRDSGTPAVIFAFVALSAVFLGVWRQALAGRPLIRWLS